MENFSCSNLSLILGVKEGCHFDRVQKPTIVLATLNGQCLETKKHPPDCNPQYATDLTWETDKNAMRKMRCNSTPVKVECYAVNDSGSREKLGYVLLSVRSAQIIYQGEDSKIKMNWHNILGVRSEFNNCKPKLMLYLIIKERDCKVSEISKDQELQDAVSINSNMLPKWLREEHLIQLGPMETCQDIFLLHINAEILTNLGQLVQEFKGNRNDDFTLIYNIFEMFFKLKSFKLESDCIYLNQKIVIKIRSTAFVLASYLNSKSHFFVRLKYNNVVIAHSEVNLQSLLTSNYLQNMKSMEKNTASTMEYYCILKYVNSKESKGDHNRDHEKLPSLKMSIKLSHVESKDITGDENEDSYSRQSLGLPITKNKIASLTNELKTYRSCLNNRFSSLEKISLLEKHAVHDKENSTRSTDNYNSYQLNIHLNSITFSRSMPDVKKVEFRFYNPKGDVIATVSNDMAIKADQTIKLQDVKFNTYFISTSDKIEELLSIFAPIINICDSTSDDKKCIAQVSFDIKRLFLQTKSECQYTEVLTDCNSKSEIGFLEIHAALEDSTTISGMKEVQEKTSETRFNNELAYKIVDELEAWKERQKEIFKEELQKREETHLTLLNEEWQRRRQCLESKLNDSIQECKTMANKLSKTIEDLRNRKLQSFEKETKLIQANEELQWKYERKLRQLQDALEKMQAEFTLKLRGLEEENRNLILQIESLSAKNYELEKARTEKNDKSSTFKKVQLNEDQMTSVLQHTKDLEEKLDNTQKRQIFFKDQYDKSAKEIHRLKMENQRALQLQIKSSKEELHNYDLEEILQADSAALSYDRIALDEIQREIDVMNPVSSRCCAQLRQKEQFIAPLSDLRLSLDYDTAKSDSSSNANASEKKLRAMIEERDALLKTGRYTIKDDVIVKLNANIRSLLMNS